MGKRRVMFTFPQELVTKPIIYTMARRFDVVPNIRKADVSEDRGWVVLELEGEAAAIDSGLKWAIAQGVRVDPIEGDVVEG